MPTAAPPEKQMGERHGRGRLDDSSRTHRQTVLVQNAGSSTATPQSPSRSSVSLPSESNVQIYKASTQSKSRSSQSPPTFYKLPLHTFQHHPYTYRFLGVHGSSCLWVVGGMLIIWAPAIGIRGGATIVQYWYKM